MNNKTKKVVVWAFIISISIFSVTSVNSSIEKANNHQQDDIKQLKELIISRLNLIYKLSTETTENKIIISELTTLRLLQDAYIQIVVDTNSRKNNDFSSSIRPVIKPSFSDKNDIMHKEKQVGLDYLKQYIKGLKILGINLTESEYKNFKTIKTQKEFLIFHKSMLFKHKKPLSILKNTNKEAKYSKKSACSVF